ncbi:MAG: hypothetical protein JXB35_12530, partial [Anaerolineae bacterium]|nr:hypothetical protein [Anaerolineae bacterium]
AAPQRFLTALFSRAKRVQIPDASDVYLPYLEFRYTYLGLRRRYTTRLIPFTAEYRLPDIFAPASDLRPTQHGFEFVNSFPGYPLPFKVPKMGNLDPVSQIYGLCGGMSSAACDFYFSGKSRPPHKKPPEKGTKFHQYLYRRQLDTFGALGRYIVKFAEWMALPDETTHGTQRRTFDEWAQIQTKLDAKVPAIIGLVYVSFEETAELWQNHQVLAYAYEEQSPTLTNIHIYDPNYPKNDGVVIRAERVTLGAKIAPGLPPSVVPVSGFKSVQLTPGHKDRKVRGFFMMPYAPQTPPDDL